jgi:predicted NBD/HSP70 family sugar kinase
MPQNKYLSDDRIVVTLDAGGTNFVFSAMRGGEFIVDPITLPSNAANLDKCLETMVVGFSRVFDAVGGNVAAISFAFPGPADYPNGIIGGFLPNFPSFRDGVALGPFLEEQFGVPVFINNDGDLFALGEALCGVLPEINARLEACGSNKRYHNLLGYTFGTGFGVGMVINDQLNRGDNSCVETFCLRHKLSPDMIAESGVSVQAIRRLYGELSGDVNHNYEPKEIAMIADGLMPGDAEAARRSFATFGEVAGDAIATAVTLVDGLIVIGGGITKSAHLIMPSLLAEMRGRLHLQDGTAINRLQMQVFNLDDPAEFARFAQGSQRRLPLPASPRPANCPAASASLPVDAPARTANGATPVPVPAPAVSVSARTVSYDPLKRTGIVLSRLGASRAISLGAYAYALTRLP